MDGGDPAGGSRELVRLIEEYSDELVFDFRHYLHRDLRDVLVDGSGLSPRLCLAYISKLPHDSATVAAMRGGPEFRGWDVVAHELADLVDAVRENTYATVAANSGKKKPKAPEAYPRPADRVRKKNQPNSFAAAARAHYKKNKG